MALQNSYYSCNFSKDPTLPMHEQSILLVPWYLNLDTANKLVVGYQYFCGKNTELNLVLPLHIISLFTTFARHVYHVP